MSLIRWNSGQDLLNFEKEFRRVFDQVNPFGEKNTETDLYESSVWTPLTDILEDQDHFFIKCDLPGIKKEDVKIQFTNGKLSISGDRQVEKEKKDRNYHRIERVTGKFFRSFQLPDLIHADQITAEFENGQLTISIPKSEAVKPKEIPVLTRG